MNYSTKRKRPSDKGRRWLYCSWAFFVLVGLVVGVFAGWLIFYVPSQERPVTDNVVSVELPPEYGTRDGRMFTDGAEPFLDWRGAEEFIPLDCALDAETQEFLFWLCKGYYIDFSFAMGLIYQESGFKANVISGTNDYGLMQINAFNHSWLCDRLGITDFLEPTQNIRAGMYILRTLFEKYDDPAKVLMVYNMGEHGASRLWDKGIYESSYAVNVLAHAETFETQIRERAMTND